MSNWVKWVKGLTTRREIIVAAAKSGRSRREMAAIWMEFMEWCDANVTEYNRVDDTDDALCPFLTEAAIDDIVATPGFARLMASEEVGWIKPRSAAVLIVNHFRHNGESEKTRALDARRKERVRKMSGSDPDKKRTRGEERREEEKEGGSAAAPPPPRFSPPTREDCVLFAQEIGLPPDEAVKFHDYQTAKGWKVGNSPMRDWRAAMRTWKGNVGKFGKPGQTRTLYDAETAKAKTETAMRATLEKREQTKAQLREAIKASRERGNTALAEMQEQQLAKLESLTGDAA